MLLAPRRARILEEKQRHYNEVIAAERIVAYQLRQFNSVWYAALENLQFYKDWANRFDLPKQISSVADLRHFPVLTNKIIRSHEEVIGRDVASAKGVFYVSTGGSTGTPVRFPTSKPEKDIEYGNTYLAKGWWGIKPFDRVIQLWGHSHLFGTGLTGKLKEIRRTVYDKVIRTYRLNAYNMSVERIKQYVQIIIRHSPQAVIGYTSAVFKIAQYANSHGLFLGNPDLKGVIVTAETATSSDIALIGKVFGKPVIIEYGMAETGAIAYSRDSSESCRILWDSFLCFEANDGLRLSTIYNRCFPLINYQTGDLVDGSTGCEGSLLGFGNIKGRAQENLTLWAVDRESKFVVSGILIVHILKSFPGVLTVTSMQISEGCIKVYVSSLGQLDLAGLTDLLVGTLSKEFGPVDFEAVRVVIEEVDSQSLAGKHRSVITPGHIGGPV